MAAAGSDTYSEEKLHESMQLKLRAIDDLVGTLFDEKTDLTFQDFLKSLTS